MRKHKWEQTDFLVITVFLSMALFLAVYLFTGCAALSKWYSQTHYTTFELTLGEEKKVVNLPDGLPSMSEAVLKFENCFNLKVCLQRFCLTQAPGHDHLDFVFIGNDVIALVWIKTNEMERNKRFLAWIYVEKKPIAAPIDAVVELVRKHDPNV